MNDKQHYLALTPPHLDKKRWIQEVDFVFDVKEGGKEWVEYLERFYKSKPRTIQERWKEEAKTYE